MATPFRPARGPTVEVPYRTSVIRADPDFEWGKKHEPFYEFSNGRRFDENTAKHGAYNYVPVNVTLSLQGNAAAANAGILTPQTDAGIFAFLGGVQGNTALGALGSSIVTPVALASVSGSASAGIVTPLGQSTINGSVNLLGINASGLLGILSVTGNSNDSVNMLGVSVTGVLGTIAISSTSNATKTLTGLAAIAAIGAITLNIVDGSASATVNLSGLSATGAVGAFQLGLSQPIMALISATGVSMPQFQIDFDNTVVAGCTIELQEQTAGGNWSSLLVDVTHTITSAEDAADTFAFAASALSNGSYEARCRTSNGLTTSQWSNVVPFSVSGVVGASPLGLLLTITH